MHLSTLLLAMALPILSTLAQPSKSGEYYTVGCPKGTKPQASQKEQLEAITKFDNLLVQKQITTAYNTYAATNFIQHAARVSRQASALPCRCTCPVLFGLPL